MRTMIGALLCAAALGAPALTAQADEAAEKAIKARQSLMQVYAFNIGGLAAMAKGEAAYDAGQASAFAGNLAALAKTKNGAMWPQGSDSGAYPEKTRAKVEAWTTYPKSAEHGAKLAKASEALAMTAGNGLDAVKAGLGDVGGACKGCHDDFRVPKK